MVTWFPRTYLFNLSSLGYRYSGLTLLNFLLLLPSEPMSPSSTSNSFSLPLSFSVWNLFRYFRSPKQGAELKLARASLNAVTCYLDPQRRKAVDTECILTRCFCLDPLLGTLRALCNLEDRWCYSHFIEMSSSSQVGLEPNQVPPPPRWMLLFLLFALDTPPKIISPCPKFWIRRWGCISCSLSDGNAHPLEFL